MLLRASFPVLWGILLYHIPITSMSPNAWHLFVIFSATIMGIILRPFPVSVVALFGLTVSIVLNVLDIKTQALSGFAVPTVWLVGSVFFIAKGFVNSRLGERIAYFFIFIAGKTPLRLAYALSFTEFLLAPFIPSSTARAGGIILPILNSICISFDSSPEKNTQNKIGSFLMQSAFHANIISSAIFLTGMVSNPLAQSFAKDQGVYFSWTQWFFIASVPGIVSLLLAPFLIYKMNKPEIEHSEKAQKMAKQKLKELGAFSRKEQIMMGILILMLFLWIFGDVWGIYSASVALLGLVLCILTKVIKFEEVLEEKKAWETMLWLSILITMCTYLKEYGFVSVISQYVSTFVSGFSFYVSTFIVLFFYYWVGYLFASNSAHVSALYVSFLGVLLALGMQPVLAGVLLACLSSLYASTTHYGSTAGSVLFSAGFVSAKQWWKTGFVIALCNFLIWLSIGSAWWKVLGYF